MLKALILQGWRRHGPEASTLFGSYPDGSLQVTTHQYGKGSQTPHEKLCAAICPPNQAVGTVHSHRISPAKTQKQQQNTFYDPQNSWLVRKEQSLRSSMLGHYCHPHDRALLPLARVSALGGHAPSPDAKETAGEIPGLPHAGLFVDNPVKVTCLP